MMPNIQHGLVGAVMNNLIQAYKYYCVNIMGFNSEPYRYHQYS